MLFALYYVNKTVVNYLIDEIEYLVDIGYEIE